MVGTRPRSGTIRSPSCSDMTLANLIGFLVEDLRRLRRTRAGWVWFGFSKTHPSGFRGSHRKWGQMWIELQRSR